MTRPLDASWVRVEDAGAPDGQGWELEQEDSELIVLDLGSADREPAEDRESMPGTSVTLTVSTWAHTQGLETDTPMMKLGDMVMLGEWDELLGSEIVLCQGTSADLTHRPDKRHRRCDMAAIMRTHRAYGHGRQYDKHAAYCFYACSVAARRPARYPVASADGRRPPARF